MIILDFKNVDPEYNLGEDPRTWTDEIYFGAFLGNQIFKINESDFSGDYPILGFARELSAICFRLNQTTDAGMYIDPEHASPDYLKFESKNGWISIYRLTVKNDKICCSAQVRADDLIAKASEYLEKAVTYCSQFSPQIKTDENIQTWLNDFTIPGYQFTL